MFHDIPEAVSDRMAYLAEIDARDRQDGTPRSHRLRQVPADTGKFLALLVASAPPGACVELGTSAGYSTLWLAMACQLSGRKLFTFEMHDVKVELAQETFRVTGLSDHIDLVVADAHQHLPDYHDIAFCFLDAEKEDYGKLFDLAVPNLVSGGLLAADNVIQFQDVLRPMLDRAESDSRVDSVIVPIGSGVLLCRKI